MRISSQENRNFWILSIKLLKTTVPRILLRTTDQGETWYLIYLRRLLDLSYRTAEGINKARARITEESIRFNELNTFLKSSNNEDILECPERIFNGDESGFSLCPKTGKVFASKGYTNLYQVKSGNEKEM